MKSCPSCSQTKPLSDFYANSSYCKACCSAKSADWAKKNRQQKRANNEAWRKKNRSRIKPMGRAHQAVFAAIKAGDLIRASICESCGSAGSIEASHADYAKPLDVKWLCIKCHRLFDASNPKSQMPSVKSQGCQ